VGRLVRNIGEERFAVTSTGFNEADQLVGVGLRRVVIIGSLFRYFPSSVKTDFGAAAVKFVMSQ